ncbi:MAG: hypothetical protein QOF48_1029 [Verrucomicrobiota bacterium]|jgi:GNAT superfamily N-acetyltransferase
MIVSVEIRRAAFGDAAVVAGFNAQLAFESEGRALAQPQLHEGVEAVLEDPAKGIYWLAEVNRHVVGQLLITYEWSDWRNGWFWWIQSVYVRPEWRGRGVFQELYHFIEKQAVARDDVCGLRLYVDSHNIRAKTAYERLALQRTNYELFELELRQPAGHVPKLPPNAAQLSRTRS